MGESMTARVCVCLTYLFASLTYGAGHAFGKVGKREFAWYSEPTLIQGGMQQ